MGDYDMAAARALEVEQVRLQTAYVLHEAAEMERERARLALEREKRMAAPEPGRSPPVCETCGEQACDSLLPWDPPPCPKAPPIKEAAPNT